MTQKTSNLIKLHDLSLLMIQQTRGERAYEFVK